LELRPICYVLSSNIASLSADMIQAEQKVYPREIIHRVRQSIGGIESALSQLDSELFITPNESILLQGNVKNHPTDKQLTDQMDFIYKLAMDINKSAIMIRRN
jgi:hypothetical protein